MKRRDSRAGGLTWSAAVTLALVLLAGGGCSSLATQARVQVDALRGGVSRARGAPISEADLEPLPAPVQRYLRRSGVLGRRPVRLVQVRQRGKIRTEPDGKWMPYTAVQHYSVEPPAFVWYAEVEGMPLEILDSYIDGHGVMTGRLAFLVNVVDAEGPELDQGELLRYLQETIFFPTALLESRVRWEAVDERSARATIRDGALEVSGLFRFNEAGDLVDFEAQRYRGLNDGFTLDLWSTPITAYRQHEGLRIPVAGAAVWRLEQGDFEYVQIELEEIAYDPDPAA